MQWQIAGRFGGFLILSQEAIGKEVELDGEPGAWKKFEPICSG